MTMFESREHQQRFLAALRTIGKIHNGKPDAEYGSALYLLTADIDGWNKAQEYIDRQMIDIEAMLSRIAWSSGYEVLIKFAGHLYNGWTYHIDPLELLRLDDRNFALALTALKMRRDMPLLADLAQEANGSDLCAPDEQSDATLVEDEEVLAGLRLGDRLQELEHQLPALLALPSQHEGAATEVYFTVLMTLLESDALSEQLRGPVREFLATWDAAYMRAAQVETWDYQGLWFAARVRDEQGNDWPTDRRAAQGPARSETEALWLLYQVYPELRMERE